MSTELSTVIQLHPNVKAAMVNPSRYMEIRGWLKTNQSVAIQWRGDHQETMMHWAFMSNWALASELKEAGLSFEATDHYGRSPMDWINDRMWYAIANDATNGALSAGSKERLRRQSEEQIIALWNQGARPSFNTQLMHPGVVWMRSGAWDLLDLLKNDEQFNWFNWAPNGNNALHAWILSPNTPRRRDFLKKWSTEFDIDIADNNNRSALWYAVDTWLAKDDWKKEMLSVVRELIEQGANPFLNDDEGVNPLSLLSRSLEINPSEFKKTNEMLSLLTKRFKKDPDGSFEDETLDLSSESISLLDKIEILFKENAQKHE